MVGIRLFSFFGGNFSLFSGHVRRWFQCNENGCPRFSGVKTPTILIQKTVENTSLHQCHVPRHSSQRPFQPFLAHFVLMDFSVSFFLSFLNQDLVSLRNDRRSILQDSMRVGKVSSILSIKATILSASPLHLRVHLRKHRANYNPHEKLCSIGCKLNYRSDSL